MRSVVYQNRFSGKGSVLAAEVSDLNWAGEAQRLSLD